MITFSMYDLLRFMVKIYFLRLYLFTILIIGSVIVSNAQVISTKNAPKSVLKIFDQAKNQITKKNYSKAIDYLDKAIKKEPLFIDAYLKKGGLLYDQKDYANAIFNFKKALEIDQNYDPRIFQALSLSFENQDNYSEALRFLNLFLENETKLLPETVENLIYKRKQLEFIIWAVEHPVEFNPIPLSEKINDSTLSEYCPSLTADGRTLFFTRVTENQEDLYYSEKDENGFWQKAKIMPNINTFENEGGHCISADGKTILFTFCSDGRSGQPKGCNIYISEKKKEKWTSPKYLEAINIANVDTWNVQPSISSDGNIIVFTSKRKGGQGNSDLWWSYKSEDGSWGKPVNLGSTINTKGNEESPFFHPDGKTLYFKSDYHMGLGSFDLFRSELNAKGEWSIPKNLGFPINTKDHEGAMIVSLDGTTAYYSRGKGDVKFDKKQSDIYTFELNPENRAQKVGFISINVKDRETKIPLQAVVELQSNENLVYKTNSYLTDNEGSCLITLPITNDYSINIEKTGYYFYSERLDIESFKDPKSEFEFNVYLDKIIKDTAVVSKPIVLNNVLFESGSYLIKEESYFELGKLFEMLYKNPSLKIEIRGHTDNVGDNEDNLILSENRAKAVKEYLELNGINTERISYKGFGETMPIDSNETKKGQKNNRRTEFIIIN